MAKTSASISIDPSETTGIILAEIGAIIRAALKKVIGEENISSELLKLTLAPNPKLGDFAYVCFQAAQCTGRQPAELAKELGAALPKNQLITKINVSGPYLNITLNRSKVSEQVLGSIKSQDLSYGTNTDLSGKTVMVEYLAPNTNKPLHIGHMRNGIIGTTVANLLEASGANVVRANNINDRGIHIVQSMLAYLNWGNGETPESTGEKGDHFVGRYYVMFHQHVTSLFNEWLNEGCFLSADGIGEQEKEDRRKLFDKQCPIVQQSYKMLSQWEAGDPEVISLWAKMNGWVYQGFDQTNSRLGFKFEKVYYESNTYKLGKDIISKQLSQGIGQKAEDGSVVIDLTDVGLGKNPISLIRQDGTSLYITQDLGLAATRFAEIHDLNSTIYVVAREQEFHFKVLFEILKRYGYSWCSDLYHLSYGMVNLPSGKMKSREGTVVDADELVDQLNSLACDVIKANKPDIPPEEIKARAEAIALGALKYMLASVSPNKDILFDPQKSVSFEGNTGPYLQYACVRIAAIEEKALKLPRRENTDNREISDEAFEVVKKLWFYPDVVQRAADSYDPSVLASGIYDIAKSFSAFYAGCPVVHDNCVDAFRLALCQATRQVLSNGLKLLGIPTPDRM